MPDLPTESANGTHRENWLLRFFHHPWFGISGWIATIVGIPLALLLYYSSKHYPQLVYCVSPARAVVVKQGTTSRLAVTFDGHEVTQDVTAVQLAIWNRGQEPVPSGAVREKFTIKTGDKVPILEATIRKKSRPVVKLDMDQTKMAEGELGLSWNMLETNDGGILQIVYAGDPIVPVKCTGVLVGQPEIRELQYPGSMTTPSERLTLAGWSLWWFMAALYGGGGILTLVVGIIRFRKSKTGTKRESFYKVLKHLVMPLILIGTAIYIYATRIPPDPPFGFN